MSAAQEEEIERLYACLHTAMSERDVAKQLAEQLQVSLFESRLKARQAIEQCKKDAIEVATEEAIREHLDNVNSMDELLRRQVSAASADKSMMNTIRSSLYDLHSLSETFQQIKVECEQVTSGNLSTTTNDDIDNINNTIDETTNSIDTEGIANVQRKFYQIMHSPEMMFFLEDRESGGIGEHTVIDDVSMSEIATSPISNAKANTAVDETNVSDDTKDRVHNEEKTEEGLVDDALESVSMVVTEHDSSEESESDHITEALI